MTTTAPAPDLVGVDDLLSPDEIAWRDAVRAFVDREIRPHVGRWFEDAHFPREIAPAMGALGVLGMHVQGRSAVEYGLAAMELEAGDSGLRTFASVQGSLAMFALPRWGSEEHKQQWLPRMATGEALGCFGLTEADAGSDPGSMRTRARRDGDDWVLDGSKMWITNGTLADVAVVWAQTDPDAGSKGIRGFVVPTDTPGFTANEVKHKLSLRASLTAELVLEGVRLPADAVFPEVSGLKGPLSCLNEARYGILWGAVGAARACFEAALAYSVDREQFGQPIAGFQLTQRKLADMVVAVNQAGLTASRIGRLKDAEALHPAQVSFGKMANVRAALDVARTARTVLGGNGITLEYPVFRHMTNLETVLTYEGTEEMHALSIGQALTGIAAFR